MRGFRTVGPVIIVPAVLVLLTVAFAAGTRKDAKYVGSATCKTCHADSHSALVTAYMKTPHHFAMADVAKDPKAVVAKFGDDAPIKQADIKYVIGSGKSYQNYMDKDMKVLPAKWDVKAQKWLPAEAVNGATQCVGCHVTNYNADKKSWTEMGVGCESCHGPGGNHVESMDAADITNLKKMDSKKRDMVCGQCHAQGKDVTGNYAFSTTFMPGDDLTKSMTINPPIKGAANSEYNDFVTSKHYEGGMSCTTCHDTHGDKAKSAHQLKKPVNDQCLTCHAATIGSLKEHAPSAKPDATCASCHMEQGSHEFKKAEKG